LNHLVNSSFMKQFRAIIKGTGSTLPAQVVKNKAFIHHEFYEKAGKKSEKLGAEIVAKLESITGIRERRYIPDNEDSVPLMVSGAAKAIANAGIQLNDLQGIIVAHNSGNMLEKGKGFHTVPNLAARLKHELKIENYDCFAYDLLFGCPGWLQGVIQAKQHLADNDEAQNILVVGLEVASRMLDPHDLDSMIFADGCGACVVSRSTDENIGILSYATFSHAQADVTCIYQGESYSADLVGSGFVKMNGRDVYKYATTWVPKVIQKSLDKIGKSLDDVDMFLFHQANGKMLSAIAQNIAILYGNKTYKFDGKVPTTIEFLGNTSVATIPTMLDLIRHGELGDYQIKKGQLVVMASVGAGMHCNSIVYQF
jgi:3-oxoacyl-[acyl-carrier-protein] synthase III